MNNPTSDEREDAAFRLKDRLWAKLVEIYHQREEKGQTSYQMIADRSGSLQVTEVEQVLTCVHYITLENASLIAECMDADISVKVIARRVASDPPTDDTIFQNMDLSSRLKNILRRNDFVVVSDVRNLSKERFLLLLNAGRITLAELEKFLGRELSDERFPEIEGERYDKRLVRLKEWTAQH